MTLDSHMVLHFVRMEGITMTTDDAVLIYDWSLSWWGQKNQGFKFWLEAECFSYFFWTFHYIIKQLFLKSNSHFYVDLNGNESSCTINRLFILKWIIPISCHLSFLSRNQFATKKGKKKKLLLQFASPSNL